MVFSKGKISANNYWNHGIFDIIYYSMINNGGRSFSDTVRNSNDEKCTTAWKVIANNRTTQDYIVNRDDNIYIFENILLVY